MIVEPRDIVKWAEGEYGFAFKGGDAGVPRGVGIDAVTLVGSAFVMSFDTTVDLGGLIVHDEDLVIENGAGLALFLDASTLGIDASIDLDAAHALPNGDLAVSFDGHGQAGGVAFADEDAIILAAGAWQSFVKGVNLDDDFAASDLNVLYVPSASPGPLFLDGFESGNTSAWTTTVP